MQFFFSEKNFEQKCKKCIECFIFIKKDKLISNRVFSPVLHFIKKPVIWFAVQIK